MKSRKNKIYFLIFIVIIVIAIIILHIVKTSESSNKTGDSELNNDKYVYDFDQTLDLENDRGFEEYAVNGTDYPSLGILSDYYDDVDINYEEDRMYLETYEGRVVVAASWVNEGNAVYIKEPEFGYLDKFILKSSSAQARYKDVKLKDVTSYINLLSGMGFSDVIENEKNKQKDTYKYSAIKDDKKVKLDYKEGTLLISVYDN